MPIVVMADIEPMDQEKFHTLDRRVMAIVFDVHNEFGRLLDEKLYKTEIATRCVAAQIAPAELEVRIRATHGDFNKDYCIDLLLCHGFMLEAKAAETLSPTHRGQSVNYLLLAGLNHGRLINFRTHRVQHEFVSTTLTLEERRRMIIGDSEWKDFSGGSTNLKAKMIALLQDWGGFLDINLYREALVHFMGGAPLVSKPVEIFSQTRLVGTQSMNLADERTAFAITSLTRRADGMRKHLQCLLEHTALQAIQWINLNQHEAEFVTLVKKHQTESWGVESSFAHADK